MRLDFNFVSLEANRIFMLMILNMDQRFEYWDKYQRLLLLCGWSDSEFDKETLRRVDLSWDEKLN